MRALIGHTGFVGGALARRYSFDRYYNSSNIRELSGHFDEITVAGMPGTKWKANAHPDSDGKALDSILSALGRINRTCRVNLVSTIDVFAEPVNVTPNTPPDATSPYGKHRFILEEYVRVHFHDFWIFRYPSLYGLGLKKNALYDLMNDHRISEIHPDDTYQWFDVDDIRFGSTLQRVDHWCPEPIAMRELVHVVFGLSLPSVPDRPPVRYDARGPHDGYCDSRNYTIPKIIKFVHETRRQ